MDAEAVEIAAPQRPLRRGAEPLPGAALSVEGLEAALERGAR